MTEHHSLNVVEAKRIIMSTHVADTKQAVLGELGLTTNRVYRFATAGSYAGDIHVIDAEDGMVRDLDEDELIAVARRIQTGTAPAMLPTTFLSAKPSRRRTA
jgi:hypothetical protein